MKILIIALISLTFFSRLQASELIYAKKTITVMDKSKTEPSLQTAFDELKLNLSANDFTLLEVKHSLLGSHFYYQQNFNGIAVDASQVVISINESGELVKAYVAVAATNNKNNQSSIPLVTSQSALNLAWNHLAVNGELLSAPKIELLYTEDLNLVYKIQINISSPFGYWQATVDAHDGRVLEVIDTALPRMKKSEPTFRLKSNKLTSLSNALKNIEQKPVQKLFNVAKILANGSAQVFDPNPVVTLARTDLKDDSPAEEFNPAYVIQELKDISMENGVYTLEGPKVTIADFESPRVAPSTSTDGNWIYERKNDAFNDAMTYVQVDKNIRHMESLGYVGKKVIFAKSLSIDANGLNGVDNSHYIPSTSQLAFGHGCVDDNEDTDVILHELGHAIEHHIVSRWGGGDTGAIGEGFGDYWAAAYSYTTQYGKDTNPNWVYKWDGHNKCWPGRKLNAFKPTYSATTTYSAHTNVNGGISDELWSTPIFQAFMELYDSGVSRDDLDKIILEAHFGLGSGVKMPVMAKSIVKTAKALFPNKDYDQVYLKHFTKQKIL